MKSIMQVIGNGLAVAEKLFLQVVMATLTAVVVLHIATRNAGFYLSWTYDVSMLIFTWLVFIGAAYAVRERSHYLIDIWSRGRLIRYRAGITIFASALMTVFLVVLVWQGFKVAWLVRGRISGAGEIGMPYYVLSVPISAILSIYHLMEVVLTEWNARRGVAP